MMTRTLSFGVGFEGATPRKERNDLPDCWCAIIVNFFCSVISGNMVVLFILFEKLGR